MKKLAYISNIPAPYTVKLITALRDYHDARGFFYEAAAAQRASFWDMPLPAYCQIASALIYKRNGRYISADLQPWLKAFDPDVVLLGGFSVPDHFLAYRWAKRKGKKVVIITELSRTQEGLVRNKTAAWQLLTRLYKDVDAVFAVTPEAVTQFRDVFGFGDKVRVARYATDLDDYLHHPLRTTRPDLTFLFANRLTESYNPQLVLEVFETVQRSYPAIKLCLNASGELRGQCELFIQARQLRQVSFLDHLENWSDLSEVYRHSDVLLLPAVFSAGNFTIYEAAASGMGLVISENVLGNGKIIVNGHDGFRLPLSHAAIAEAMIAYLSTPGLLKTHGAINKQKVADLGPTGTARLYHDLIQSIL